MLLRSESTEVVVTRWLSVLHAFDEVVQEDRG